MRTAPDVKIIIGRKKYDELKICSIEIAYTSNKAIILEDLQN